MVLPIEKDGEEIYQCEECGFKFEKKEHASTCENACSQKGICNSEMAKFAITEDQSENKE